MIEKIRLKSESKKKVNDLSKTKEITPELLNRAKKTFADGPAY